ncbi:MAG: anti-sigma factor family protein [Phycisphaerales bacterium JB037]
MTDHTREYPGGYQPEESGAWPLAAMLRAAADGELTPQQQARLDAHLATHPADADRIAFEQQLRGACAKAMVGPICPDSLRARIAQIANEATSNEASLAGALGAHAGETRKRGFWLGENRRVLQALAAAVAVLVGGAFIWQVARLSSPALTESDAGAMLASFVAGEHSNCVDDPARASKFTIRELPAAPAMLASILGSEPTLPDLADLGFRFLDAGKCHVPGKGRSAHLRFETDGSALSPRGVSISLFVQEARESDLHLEEGRTYVFEPTIEYAHSAERVYAWRVGGLKYYLVGEDLDICERFRAACGMPPAEGDSPRGG